MTSATTETTTTLAPSIPDGAPTTPELLLGRFDRVEIKTRAEALATLRDGSALVKVSDTAEIMYTVRRFHDERDGSEVLLLKPVDGKWRELDPAWQLPATIIYTPQN